MKRMNLLSAAATVILAALAGYWGLIQFTGNAELSDKRFPDDTLSVKDVSAKASSLPRETVDGELLIYPPIDTPFIWDVEVKRSAIAKPLCSRGGYPRVSINPTREWLTNLPPGSVGGRLFVTDAGDSWDLGGGFVKDQAGSIEAWNSMGAVVEIACAPNT